MTTFDIILGSADRLGCNCSFSTQPSSLKRDLGSDPPSPIKNKSQSERVILGA